MTPSQQIRNAIDRADQWRIDWSDDDMIVNLESIMNDLEESYDHIMGSLRDDYSFLLDAANDPKCVLHV